MVNTKDEIIVLDTDQEAWSDDESFAQLVDDKVFIICGIMKC